MKKKNSTMFSLILIVVFLTTLNIFITYDYQKDEYEKKIENEIFTLKNQYEQIIDYYFAMIETTKQLVENFPSSSAKDVAIYNPLIQIDDVLVRDSYIGYTDGSFVAGSSWLSPEGFNHKERIWYIEALEKRRTIVTRPYIDSITNKLTITISTPIEESNEIIGVLGFDVHISDIFTYLSNIDDDFFSDVHIFTSDLVLIGDKSNDLKIGETVDLNLEHFNNVETYLLSDSTIKVIKNDYYTKVKNTNWILHVSTDNVNLNVLINTFKQPLLITNMLINLVLIFLYLSYRNTRIMLEKAIEESNEKNRTLLNVKKKIEAVNKNLKEETQIDPLTGIYNRRFFDQLLYDYIHFAQEYSKPISLMLIDIDDFKAYNDLYGHVAGDQALKRITATIQSLLPKAYYLCRYGGEEFAIISYNTDFEFDLTISDHIINSVVDLQIPNQDSKYSVITASIGLHQFIPKDSNDILAYVEKTDELLYQAKKDMKNNIKASKQHT
jgi:diguanylate cyclase (GGDEF)-like protein